MYHLIRTKAVIVLIAVLSVYYPAISQNENGGYNTYRNSHVAQWDVFVKDNYAKSPEVFTTMEPWSGLPSAVYLHLYSFIESHSIENVAFVLEHQKEVYNDLEERLQNKKGSIADQLLRRLHAGELVKVRDILVKEAQFSTSKDGAMYYEGALIEELNFNSLDASFLYRLAIMDNNSTEFNVSYAELLFQHNNLSGAIAQLDSMNTTKDKKIKARLATLLGNISFTQGHLDEALTHYTTAVSLSKGKNRKILHNLAVLQYTKGNYDKAISNHKKILRLEQRQFGSKHLMIAKRYQILGNIYLASKNVAKAEHYFNESLRVKNGYFSQKHSILTEDYKLLAQIAFQKKNEEDALFYLNKALENEQHATTSSLGEIVTLQNDISKMYYENRLHKQSLAQLEISLEMLSGKENMPLSSSVHYNMGLVYTDMYKTDLATYHFDKALNFDRQVYPPKINPEIVIGYKSLNIYSSAKEEYSVVSHIYKSVMNITPEKSWRFLPNIGAGYSSLVGLYSIKSNHDIALEYFLVALKIDGVVLGESHHDLGVDHNILGVLYLQKGNKERATYHLYKAKKNYVIHLPENHPYRRNLETQISKLDIRVVE